MGKQAEGNALAEAGRFDAALACWESALERKPSAALHELRAQAFMQLGRDFDAVLAAEAAVRLDPGWFPAHLTLGRARLNLGEVELARQALARAVTLEPNSAELQAEHAEVVSLAQKHALRVNAAIAD